MSTHSATYCPEDNKLRLYPACRLSAEDFARVKRMGFKWAPKQGLFVAGAWSPDREDMLLEMCDGYIGDEDYSPEERAADRAERFAEYGGKRISEAVNHANTFDAGPSVFGHQSAARAHRQADRHDRHRKHAVNQWQKAEYWQRRTAGVISNALHRSSAKVRRTRILRLEAERRATAKAVEDCRQRFAKWLSTQEAETDIEKRERIESSLARCERWDSHYELRLTYERAMLAEEGGAAYDADMVPGGFVGGYQIHGVNKSPTTGLVVSVKVWGKDWHGNPGFVTLNIERLAENAYRAPTEEELAEFKAATKARKKATPTCPIINPTPEDSQRLQAIWNARHERGRESVTETTAAQWERSTKGSDFWRMVSLFADGFATCYKSSINERVANGDYPVCKVRVACRMVGPDSLVRLTDKPVKSIPLNFEAVESAAMAKQTT